MKTLTEAEFLSWAARYGLGLDPQYPKMAVLSFGGLGDARFWEVPEKPERRPYFLASLLELFGDWHHARYLLQTDHHNVVHVEFREASDVDRWVTEMAGRGFSLPEELPDETFKQPPWMPKHEH